MDNSAMAGRMNLHEKALLINLIRRHAIVENCKKTDAVSLAEKINHWQEIQKEFNSHAFVSARTWKQLRKAWGNIKARRKLKHGIWKRQSMQSGGVPLAMSLAQGNEVGPHLEVPLIINQKRNSRENDLIIESAGVSEDMGLIFELGEVPSEPSSTTVLEPALEVRTSAELHVLDPSHNTEGASRTSTLEASSSCPPKPTAVERELNRRLQKIKAREKNKAKLHDIQRAVLEVERKIKETELASAVADLGHKKEVMELEIQEKKAESRRRQEAHEIQMEILRRSV